MNQLIEYECSEGHAIAAAHELSNCLAYFRGSPCKGELKRVGRGSRKKG